MSFLTPLAPPLRFFTMAAAVSPGMVNLNSPWMMLLLLLLLLLIMIIQTIIISIILVLD